MDLRLTIKAVQSLQSFTPELGDEVTIFGEVLGLPVTLNSPSAELLAKLDELIYGLNRQTPDESASPQSASSDEYVDYQAGADYTLGGLVDD